MGAGIGLRTEAGAVVAGARARVEVAVARAGAEEAAVDTAVVAEGRKDGIAVVAVDMTAEMAAAVRCNTDWAIVGAHKDPSGVEVHCRIRSSRARM